MRHSDQLRKFSNNHSLPSTTYYLIFFSNFCPIDFISGFSPSLPGLFWFSADKSIRFWDLASPWFRVGVWTCSLESRACRYGLFWDRVLRLGGFLGGEMLSGGNIQFCPQSYLFWKAVLCGISHTSWTICSRMFQEQMTLEARDKKA